MKKGGKNIKKFLLFFIFIFFSSDGEFTDIRDLHFIGKVSDTKIIGSFESYKITGTFIQDSAGNKFVVKQRKKGRPHSQRYIIREVLASYIAQLVGIEIINKVCLISCNATFPGKIFHDDLASIHAFVPGASAKNYRKYKKLNIQQTTKECIPSHEHGLTKEKIKNLKYHPDLPVIAAFDTFIGNRDRNLNNLFYDSKKKHFYGIDHEVSFVTNLAEIALLHIGKIKKLKICFSRRVLYGLKRYKNTLQKLLTTIKPKQILKKLRIMFLEAGCFGSINDLENQLEKYDRYFKNCYCSCQKLINEIDDILINWRCYIKKRRYL